MVWTHYELVPWESLCFISACNVVWTHYELVPIKTLSHLAKLTQYLFSVVRTYVDVVVNYVKQVSDRLKW